MSRIAGQVYEDAVLPQGTYFAQFTGFARKDGEIILREKSSVFTDDDGAVQSRKVIKLYWQFMVVVGAEASGEVAGSTAFKGVTIVPTEAGPAPRFKAPGAYAPNFIIWLDECGLDFVTDLAQPIFDTPLTNQTILEGLERVLLGKAHEGHIVSIKVEELPDGGAWVAWKGGVSAAPPEVSGMITPGLERPRPATGPVTPVQAEQKRLAEHVRYLMGVAADAEVVDVAILKENVRVKVKEWGIMLQPNVPILSLLNVEQLHRIVDDVVVVLLSEEVEFEGLAPLEPEPPPEDELLFGDIGEIPF